MLLAPYFWNRRIYGFSSWPDGVIAVGQVFIVLEKSIVQLIHSVRLYLLCSESGFSQKGNSGTKSLAYTTLVRPILEYGVACWDPYREDKYTHWTGCKRKRLNLHNIRTNWTGKHCRSVEGYRWQITTAQLSEQVLCFFSNLIHFFFPYIFTILKL